VLIQISKKAKLKIKITITAFHGFYRYMTRKSAIGERLLGWLAFEVIVSMTVND
jgi:hypothetical protein